MITLIQLFISFFQIGLLSFGGGYSALPLIQQNIVNVHHWLNANEFIDLITISQMTPGPIAINAATFVGNRVYGIIGSIVATFGNVLPSLIIVLCIAYFYFKYKNLTVIQGILDSLRPAVVGLIASAGLSIAITCIWNDQTISITTIQLIPLFLFLGALIILRKYKPNPILVMVGCGILGGIIYTLY